MGDATAVGVLERRNGNELIIALVGELDAGSASHLTDHFQLLPLDDRDLSAVTVDLLSLRFLDSAGITALLELHRRTAAHRLDFRLVNANEHQHQVLEIDGLLDYLGVQDTQK